MSVVTKTGDKGTTARFGGERVSKHHPSVVANGEVDELNSAIGILATHELPTDLAADLTIIQEQCFTLGSQLATPPDASVAAQEYIPRLVEGDIARLEERINILESVLPPQKQFILPGGTQAAALAFWVRTVARRAERAVAALAASIPLDPLLLKYLNRLSDYFYILGRTLNARAQVGEIKWSAGPGTWSVGRK